MKTILVFGLTSIVGGVETYIINLYEKLKDNYKFSFILQEELTGMYKKYFEDKNCNFYVVGNLKKTPVKTLNKLKKIYKENLFDYAYLNMSNASLFLYTIFLKKYSKNCKIISHSHNGDDKKKLQHKIFRHYLVRHTDIFLTCSDVAGFWMFGEKIMNSKRVIKINNAIDSKHYCFSTEFRTKIRNKFNLKDDDFLIGHIGRFEEQKNHKFILDLANKFKGNTKVKFLLIGTGSLFENIKNEIEQNKLDNVILTGVISDTYKYYSAMDSFILPSIYEGLPIVGIEAQTNGLTCLFSSNISVQSSIANDTLFLPLEIDTWEQALNKIIVTNSKLGTTLRKNGVFNCINSGFDLDDQISIVRDILGK